jgi:iron(III) transport system substrate-binding protein
MRVTASLVSTVLGCLLTLVISFSTIPARAQTPPNSNLIEGAKKEGRLMWYTAMSSRDAQPILEAFMKEYPFVKAEFLNITSSRIINRINTETLAGKWLFDVVATNNLPVISDRLLPYSSPEAKSFSREFRDPENRWIGYDHNYYVLAYNTRMVEEKDLPKDYDDLLHPRWKERIMMDPGDYEWYGALVTAWGRNKADNYMRNLAKQDIQWRRGHTLLLQLIAAGEAPLGLPYANSTERMKKEGAPVDWVDTFNPIVTGLNYIGIAGRPKNPHTAKLFIDFILSQKGQEIFRSRGRLPARSDVKPLFPKADPAKLRLAQIPGEVHSNIREYAQQFRAIFGVQ